MSRLSAELLITAGVEGLPHLERLIDRIDDAGGETDQLRESTEALKREWDGLKEKEREKRLRDLADAANRSAQDFGLLGKKVKETKEELDAIAQAKITLGLDNDDKVRQQIEDVTQAYRTLKDSGELTGKELARANDLHRQKVAELEAKLGAVKPTLADISLEMGKVVGAASGLTAVAKEAIEFEKAMAGVKKVVDGTPEEMEALGEQVKELAYELGLVPEAVAEITAQGGQLGVAFGDLPEFTRLAGQMSVAFGITASDAAEAAAKIQNVFGATLTEMRALGDAINTLGNNTAAKEGEIVAAMQRIGGTAKQFGLAAEEAAALSSAFISLGQSPEVAGTAINALLTKLQTAPAQTQGFKDALEGIGLSAEALAQNIRNNPEQALLDFMQRLEQLDNQTRAIVITELFGAEYADNISLAAGSLDTLRDAFALVADQAQTAGAMQREFDAAMSTTDAKINQAKIAIGNMAKTLGQHLLPVIASVAEGIGSAANAINEFAAEYPVITQFAAYLGTAKVAMIAFGGATRVAGAAMRLMRADSTATAASLGQFVPAIASLRGHMQGAVASMQGMSAAMIAQQTAAGAASLAMRGLSVAMRALLANPVGLVIAGVAAAMQFFGDAADSANARLDEMGSAVGDADKAVSALDRKLRAGLKLESGEVEQALAAMQTAADKSRDAVLSLQDEILQAGEISEAYDTIKDIIPFWDSKREKLTAAREEYRRVNDELERLKTLQEEQAASAALEKIVRDQERAADATKGITEQSRRILDDLDKINHLAGIVTAEQARALDNTVKQLSSTAAIDEAEAQIQKLFEQRKITAEEEDKLLQTLAERRRELGREEVKVADASGKAATYSAEQVKTLADAYDTLGVRIPETLGAIDQADAKIVAAFGEIVTKTQVSAEQMGELMSKAFANIQTEAGAAKIREFYKGWLQEANVTTEQAAALTRQSFEGIDTAAGGLTQALKTLNIDTHEFATGISGKAQAVLDAFAVAAGHAGGSLEQLARIYDATKKQAGGNRQEVEALEAALLKSVDGDKKKAEAVREIAKSLSDTADAASKAHKEGERSLNALGLAIDDVKNKTSSGVSELADNWRQGMAHLKNEGKVTADAVNTAFANAFGKLKSAADFKALHAAMKETGTLGKLSADNLAILQEGMVGGAEAAHALANALAYSTRAKYDDADAARGNAKADKEAADAKKELADAAAEEAKAQKEGADASKKGAEAKKEAASVSFQLYNATNLNADAMKRLNHLTREWSAGINNALQNGSDVHHWNRFAKEIGIYANQLRDAQAAIDALNESTGDGTVTMNEIAETTLKAQQAMFGLDNTTLNNLNAAIDTARQKLADMKQEAEDTRASLEAQLASLRGDDSIAQSLNEQKRLRELNLKLQEAEAKGQQEIAAEYRRAIELQQQVFAEERRQQAARKADEAKRKEEAAKRQSSSTSSNSSRGNTSGGKGISAGEVVDALDGRLAEERKAGREEFARELRDAFKRRPR